MFGGEETFGLALLREAEQLFGDSATLFPHTSQLYTDTGLNVSQLDAVVILDEDAIIGSKKTRLLPEHVVQLANTIETVKSYSSSIPQLAPFQGKQIHGKEFL